MTEDSNKSAQSGNSQAGQFAIQKIYIKDVSFETPHSPDIFRQEWKPSVNMEMANNSNRVDEAIYETILTITLTVSLDDKTVYLVEVNQAGIFHINGFPDAAMEQMLSTVCPNILFPFAREFISDLVTRGGFPQLLLAPVNFDALYAQHKQQQEQAQTTKH
ncbi:MAG: protein-export chaperone SecB [Thiotrichales bacterium]|nr:protein-export chaperone SecB [Thiotrichales bacterium]